MKHRSSLRTLGRLLHVGLLTVGAAACSGANAPPGDGANEAPTVTFLAPADGTAVVPGAPLVLVARVSDAESPLDALRLTWEYGDGTPLAGRVDATGEVVTLELAAGPPMGADRVTLTVTDPAGATGRDTLLFAGARLELPTIAWETPVDGSTVADDAPLLVTGTVADADTLDRTTLSLAWSGSMDLSGAPSAPDADGRFRFSLVALPRGAHDITLTARDVDGGTATFRTSFTVVAGAMEIDEDADGVPAPEDCDDGAPSVRPGAEEVVGDGIDQDCDGGDTCFADGDGDGFAATAGGTLRSEDLDCDDAREARASAPRTDCNDASAAIFPGAEEVPGDELDQDCDGRESCFVDADGDGRRTMDASATVMSSDLDCDDFGEIGRVSTANDCDDGDPRIGPGFADTLGDGVDSDCDGYELCFVDSDDDGFIGDPGVYVASLDNDCDDAGEAYATEPRGDCEQGDPRSYPGAPERCDGVDNDCDAVVDADELDAFVLVAAGPMTANTEWSRTDREYCLTGTVTVLPGVTLRATEGVRIGSTRASVDGLVIEGRLELAGTSARPIALSNVTIGSNATPAEATVSHVSLDLAEIDIIVGTVRATSLTLTRASALRGNPLVADGVTALAGCAIPVRRRCRIDASGESSIDRAVLEQSDLYLFGGGTVSNSRMSGGELVFWPSPPGVPTPARTLRDSVFSQIRWYNVSGASDIISVAGLVLERNVFEGLDVSLDRFFIDGPGTVIRNNHFGAINGTTLFHVSTSAPVVVQYNTFLAPSVEVLRLTGSANAGAALEARENYWGTTNETTIQSMIGDRSDSSLIDNFIYVLPYLTSPHPGTPAP